VNGKPKTLDSFNPGELGLNDLIFAILLESALGILFDFIFNI
jgi:hypothetical protein